MEESLRGSDTSLNLPHSLQVRIHRRIRMTIQMYTWLAEINIKYFPYLCHNFGVIFYVYTSCLLFKLPPLQPTSLDSLCSPLRLGLFLSHHYVSFIAHTYNKNLILMHEFRKKLKAEGKEKKKKITKKFWAATQQSFT